MNAKYHIEITRKALSNHFSEKALRTILRANINQDSIKNQINHDHFHFDSNTFEEGFDYIQQQNWIVINAIDLSDFRTAQKAFGRVLHTWQDFYSHSNYVRLWCEQNQQAGPSEIIHNDETIMNHPDLRSGINYGLFEYLALLPGLSSIITPLMPNDSHAKMNLDTPRSGPLFEFAFTAARKRTKDCLTLVLKELAMKNVNGEKILGFLSQ